MVDFLRFFWKIIIFVFLMFIFIIQLLQNLKSVRNAFSNPFADCDISTRSSEKKMQFTVEPFGSNMGSESCLLRKNGLSLIQIEIE